MSLPFLQSFGLTQNESDLYELLLRLGEAPIATILKEATMKRPTVYKSLYSLEKKGLVTKQDIKKKIHFKPEPPTKLFSLAEDQYQSLERAKDDLQAVLPHLTSTYITAVEKPIVTTFEGVEGLKQIYEDTIRVGKPIYALLQTAEVEPTLFQWLTQVYTKKRVKAGIHAQVVVASGKWSEYYQSKDTTEIRSTILVPNDRFPLQHEINIYGDKVAFMNYKKGEALIGIVIHHPLIAQTAKAWFDLAWTGAEHITQPVAESEAV
jgi:sugar-specific transcriptional regulator TrmB